MFRTFSSRVFLSFALPVLWTCCPSGAAAAPETDIILPLVINVLQSAGVDIAQVNAAVQRANEIYKKAGIRLQVVKYNPNVANPGDGNGQLTRDERDELRKQGAGELPVSNLGTVRGVKVTIGEQPDADKPGVNGLAIHKNPVAIIRKNPDDTPPDMTKTGNTMAHEIGHILTLRDLYDPSTKDRLMHGYSNRTDTALTPAEIAEIRGEAARRGQVLTWNGGPSVPAENQRAAKADPEKLNPAAEAHMNVWMGSLTAPTFTDDFDLRLTLGGTVPIDGEATYRLLINSDAAPTGETIAGVPGIDRIVRADVVGSSVQFSWEPVLGGPPTIIPGGTIIREPEFVDDQFLPAFEYIGQDVLDVRLSRVDLGLPAGPLGLPIPLFVVSGSLSAPDDFFAMSLDMRSDFTVPQLLADRGLIGTDGDLLNLSGTGFRPDTSLQILLDDLPLTVVNTDPLGAFDLFGLALPGGLEENELYFLSAVDMFHAESGHAVVHTVPEPSAWALMMLAVLILAVRRRKR